MILLWGLHRDPPMDAVRAHLQEMGEEPLFLNQRQVLETRVSLEVGVATSASVEIGDCSFDLMSVTAAYLRPYNSCDLPQIAACGIESPEYRHAMRVDDLLSSWTELSAAYFLNPLDAMTVNNSKPYQLAQIRSQGWSVPDTLLTTDPQAALQFWEQHGEVIYKSVSAVRSKVRRLASEDRERLSELGACPAQFQQYIAGTDYRVHVAGERVFACEVRSEADDYRYPGEREVELVAATLPQEIEERCRRTAEHARLPLTGIDLRRTAAGEWFCFELNPSPGFSYYESMTGHPIAEAVARLLVERR